MDPQQEKYSVLDRTQRQTVLSDPVVSERSQTRCVQDLITTSLHDAQRLAGEIHHIAMGRYSPNRQVGLAIPLPLWLAPSLSRLCFNILQKLQTSSLQCLGCLCWLGQSPRIFSPSISRLALQLNLVKFLHHRTLTLCFNISVAR